MIKQKDSAVKLKLCVFPNDPILSYYEKGEIKERYFNPNNFFDEIDVISFTKKEINESKVKEIAGTAELKIHCVGKINLKNKVKYIETITNLVKTINPNVIRAYNPRLEGWFAAKCSKTLGIPLFVSLHTQYDRQRNLMKKHNLKKFLALKYSEKFLEPFVLKNADKISIVYKIIEPYVLKHKVPTPELLYNGIDIERFTNSIPLKSLPKPLIISVGNLIKEKNHQCIIEAMKELDAHCIIIGNGNMYDQLMDLIKTENLENKITIIKSVPHKEIQNYYKSAKIFALAYDPELEGLPMPVVEAMASGLPVVIPFPKKNMSDGLEEIAVFSQRNPISFSKNIKNLLEDPALYQKISKKSLMKAKEFDNRIIEKRESEIYSKLIVDKKEI